MTEPKQKSLIREITEIAIIITVLILVRSFGFGIYYVPSSSMKNTLQKGDYVLATKFDYGYSWNSLVFSPFDNEDKILHKDPKRGDIVIIYLPNTLEKCYVKRVIGLPGDRVSLLRGKIFINGRPVEQEYLKDEIDNTEGIAYKLYKETSFDNVTYQVRMVANCDYGCNNDYSEIIVPEGRYFVMGDNRNFSNDSRYDLGLIPAANLIAKARFIGVSFSHQLFNFPETLMPSPIKWLGSFVPNRTMQPL